MAVEDETFGIVFAGGGVVGEISESFVELAGG